MRSTRFLIWIILFSISCILPAACAPPKKMTVGAAATLMEDIANSAYKQSDTRVIREGMPAYLMLIDGMVEAWPNNGRLLIAAAQSYASFASAFVESQDADYSRALYGRARDYAIRSLELRGLHNAVEGPFDDFEAGVQKFGKDDVPYVFWTAACWGNWIRLNMDSMEAMAELPRVELLVKKALELDEGYYYGSPHLFMGILHASRPKMAGGDLSVAQAHFLKAIELGEGKFLAAYIYYADQYAKRAFDKKLYISILQKALETPADIVPELTLLNTVSHSRAKKMLEEADEYF